LASGPFFIIICNMKKRIFPTLIALSALSVSASAAFYSITGLSKLFAGASLEVMIMAGSLELAKLVIASLLYQYWDKLNKLLKIYLTIATFILILITSAGIYGFLSSAYQDVANKSHIAEREIGVYELKKQRLEESLIDYNLEKDRLTQDISQLRSSLSTGITTQYVDKKTGQLVTTTSTTNKKLFESQLNSALETKSIVDNKVISLNDSITSLDIKILDMNSSFDGANELGPLKYLSNITGKSMDSIINWFLLIIVFVFDPLAICLVIAANFAFKQLQSIPLNTPQPQQINENPPLATPTPPPAPPIIINEPTQVTPNTFNSNFLPWKKNKPIQETKKSSNNDENTIRYM
jgi:hypothetical protein